MAGVVYTVAGAHGVAFSSQQIRIQRAKVPGRQTSNASAVIFGDGVSVGQGIDDGFSPFNGLMQMKWS